MMKTRRTFLLFGLLALPLFGCNNEAPSTTTPGIPSPKSGTTTTDIKKIKAGLVTDTGGIDDKSFNQSAWDGLQKAQKTLGAEVKYTESKANADYATNLSRYAQNGYDVVFAVGFLMQDAVKDVAKRYPNVKFAIIDGDAPNLPNVVSIKFREEEGSYLAGALAGLTTKTNTVGFVGGMEMPLIVKFEAGYAAGVKTTNPKAQVKVGYTGQFNDPQKGQELAISQMDAKADIIYHAAGKTGLGVIKAVENRGAGFYAIGVDKDQDGVAPGRVLTSMVKRVDVGVYSVCQEVVEGGFKAGTVVLGIKEEGIALSSMTYTARDVPPAAMAKLEALKKQIVDGTLKPPTTREEEKTFVAPK